MGWRRGSHTCSSKLTELKPWGYFSAPDQFSLNSFFLPAKGTFSFLHLLDTTNIPMSPDHSHQVGLNLPSLSCLFLPKDNNPADSFIIISSAIPRRWIRLGATIFLESSMVSIIVLALENLAWALGS